MVRRVSGRRASFHQSVEHSPGETRCERRSWSLLRQEADISQDVLHFPIGQLSSPGMHRAEDDAVLDRSQQLLI